MMKYILIILGCCLVSSCSDSFINHDLEFEKLGACSEISESIKMISNINGERYEFYSCLDDGFDGKNYSVERQGDSVIVSFPKTTERKKALYKLILDIDAKPKYNLIILDGREVIINSAEK